MEQGLRVVSVASMPKCALAPSRWPDNAHFGMVVGIVSRPPNAARRDRRSVQRRASRREVEVGVGEQLAVEGVVPPFVLVVRETYVLQRLLEEQPVGSGPTLDARIEGVRERVEAVEAVAHVDRVVWEPLVV